MTTDRTLIEKPDASRSPYCDRDRRHPGDRFWGGVPPCEEPM